MTKRLPKNYKAYFLLIFIFYTLSSFRFQGAGINKATLTLEITDLRSSLGTILVSVFNQAEGFPAKADKAYKTLQQKVQNRSAIVFIPDLPFGEYAIAILHDEDNNGKMDTNFLGVPKEGYGSSNDVQPTFSPPNYEKAKFMLNTAQRKIKIKMIY